MEKRIGLIMLPSKNRNKVGMLLSVDGYLLGDIAINGTGLTVKGLKQFNTFQCLYVTSDEEIQEGDYVLRNTSTVQQVNSQNAYSNTGCITLEYARRWCKKIIASTDDSLILYNEDNISSSLFKIPIEFVIYFIAEYNKKNVITEAMVEYTQEWVKVSFSLDVAEVLKVNQDNTICIRPIKTSWNAQEVESLCKASFEMYMSSNSLDDDELAVYFKEWIKGRLQ